MRVKARRSRVRFDAPAERSARAGACPTLPRLSILLNIIPEKHPNSRAFISPVCQVIDFIDFLRRIIGIM